MININPITLPQNNNIISIKTAKRAPKVSFTGLESTMGKKIYNSPETLQALAGLYKSNNGVVGTLPREMITALQANGTTRADMSKNIKAITGGFSDTVSILREAEVIGAEISNSFDAVGFNAKISEAIQKEGLEGVQKVANEMYGMGAVSKDDMAKIEQRAGSALGEVFKEAGILPENGCVEIKRLGNGAFGNAFKVSFKDEDGNKIFHDKVLKVYKDPETEEKAITNIAKKTLENFQNMSEDDYIQYSKGISIGVYKSIMSQFGEDIDEEALEAFEEQFKENIPMLKKAFNVQKNMTLDDCVKQYKEQIQGMKSMHGITAEANRAMFLRRIAGDMSDTNYAGHHFYDVNNMYALTEMSDDTLPPIKRNINLEKYGYTHYDIDLNPANTVNGRIIDIGGIASEEQLEKYQSDIRERLEQNMKLYEDIFSEE